MKQAVIQIHDKGGVRIEKVSIGRGGLTIGRAWSSDVILQDKYVDPDHVTLSVGDGGVILVADLATTNGSSVAGKRLSGEAKPYRLGDVIKIGDTNIRVFDQSAGVAATSLRSGWYLLAEKFNSGATITALTLLTLAFAALVDWLFAAKPLNAGDILISVFALLVGLLLCALVLGFIAKLIRGESGLRSLWVLGCISILLLNVISLLLMVTRFNLQNVDVAHWLSVIGFGALSVWGLVGLFSYMSYLGTRNKWICSILIVLSVFAFIRSDEWLKEDHELWNAYSRTEEITLPPALLFKDRVSADEYQQETDLLFDFEELGGS